jgi:REP element-mobilizing transposase RayT
VAVHIHLLWHVAGGAGTLAPDAVVKLAPYVTRYGQTLGCTVYAVGGADDHLHVLLELPPNKSYGALSDELTRATARFVREAYGPTNFAWDTEYDAVSVGDDELAEVTAYIAANADRHASGELVPAWEGDPGAMAGGDDETPDWLREALDFRRGGEG